MEYDELELDTLGDQKTALFVILSDTDSTFNFVAALMYSQLFNLLCDKADDFYGGRLPVHVRLILDEFANIGQIPNFDKLIATIRSREISASIILQSQSQLRPSTRMRQIPSSVTVTAPCFWEARRNPRSRKFRSCWGKRPLISITSPKTGAARFPTASVIRN